MTKADRDHAARLAGHYRTSGERGFRNPGNVRGSWTTVYRVVCASCGFLGNIHGSKRKAHKLWDAHVRAVVPAGVS